MILNYVGHRMFQHEHLARTLDQPLIMQHHHRNQWWCSSNSLDYWNRWLQQLEEWPSDLQWLVTHETNSVAHSSWHLKWRGKKLWQLMWGVGKKYVRLKCGIWRWLSDASHLMLFIWNVIWFLAQRLVILTNIFSSYYCLHKLFLRVASLSTIWSV